MASSDPRALVRLASRLPSVIGGAADVLDTLRTWPRTRRDSRFETNVVDAPDERWDELWSSARSDYDIVGARNADFLRWRFPKAVGTRYLTLQRRADPRLRAYAIVQWEPSTGTAHIRDLFGHRADLGRMLDVVLKEARRSRAASLSIRFLGSAELRQLFVERGFTERPDTRAVVVGASPVLDALLPVVRDARRWHLLDVDEDS